MSLSAQEQRLLEATNLGDVEEVEDVLEGGVNPNVKGELDSTPLHIAAEKGNIILSKLLLEYGADQDARNESNSTPLHCAASHGHSEIVQLLLIFWADPQTKDNTGSIPLHYAANDTIVQLLLSNGEFSEATTESRNDQAVQKPIFPIKINGNDLDESIEPALNASKTNYIIVQTRRSLSPTQRRTLIDANLELYDCICEKTYLCGYLSADLERIRRIEFVAYVDIYRQEFKIDPHLKKEVANLNDDKKLLIVILFHDATKLVVENARAEIVGKIEVGYDGNSVQFFKRKAHLTVPITCLDSLATIDEVRKIEKVHNIGLRNVEARGLMNVGNDNGHLPGQTYQGEGQVITIADTGLDTGISSNLHAAFQNRVHIYKHEKGFPADIDGHGTHVCGSAVGDGNTKDGIRIMGTAPRAKLVFQSDQSKADLTNLLYRPYTEHSARVHSYSWGDEPPVGGQLGYTPRAEEIDSFIWDYKQTVVCWAAGNDATYDFTTGAVCKGQIGSEAAAKNCITVGASENNRPEMSVPYSRSFTNQFPGVIGASPMARNPSQVAAFSSRGPTMMDDKGKKRIKPDVVAPGTLILSARSRYDTTGHVWDKDNKWCFRSGTSMAAPLVAGCAAVLREALLKNGTAPNALISAALIKALLINGADPLSDITPNVHSGFGRVNLANSLTAACGHQGTKLIEQEISDTVRRLEIFTQVETKYSNLKTTLVWSDPPENSTIRNKLRLEVEDETGEKRHTRRPNNNVHQVDWKNISSGKFTIRVGSICFLDVSPQPFALVWRLY
ncbi:peptidase S8 and S53 [Trichoderma chlorosporum]